MSLRGALPLILPLVLIQVGLLVYALVDLFRAERRVRGGNKPVWALVIVLGGIIGPLIYILAGREEG